MSELPWRVPIVPGTPVTIDGVPYVVDEVVDGWVRLVGHNGERLPMISLRVVARHLRTDDAPPAITQRGLRAEERLSAEGKQKLKERRAIVRWFEHGLTPEQPADTKPAPPYDPELVPDPMLRIRVMSTALAESRGIKYASARRLITRVLENESKPEGQYDPRMLDETRSQQHEFFETWVREFLLDREFQSSVSAASTHVMFSAWLLRTHGVEAPALRTFERVLHVVYERFPHLKQKAKTRASAAVAPKVALQRRFAMRCGEYWFMDSTKSNVMLRDPYAPQAKARNYRLNVTMVMDGATRYVVGSSFGTSLDSLAAGLALANAFKAMVDERETITIDGRTYPRPFIGLPRAISRYPIAPRRLILDNGKEFLNRYGMYTLNRLGIDVEPQRVRDGRAKAALERFFGTYKLGFEQKQTSYLGASVDERGRDADKDVFLTWDQLHERHQEWIDLYNVTEHEGLFASLQRRISPADHWIDLAHQQGSMETVAWQNEWIRFLPPTELKLRPYGVERRGMYYNAPIIRALIDTDGFAPSGKWLFFHDPSDLRQLYCFDPDGNAYEIPWVMRTEDVGPISDIALDWARGRLEGESLSRLEYSKRLRDLVLRWQYEDQVLQVERPGRNAAEVISTQLDALRSVDTGSIIAAEPFLGEEISEALDAAVSDESHDDDSNDSEQPYDDLFGEFA